MFMHASMERKNRATYCGVYLNAPLRHDHSIDRSYKHSNERSLLNYRVYVLQAMKESEPTEANKSPTASNIELLCRETALVFPGAS